jgi:hypothetical protein
MIHILHLVVFGLHKERGRGPGGHTDVRVQFKLSFVLCPQMAWIKGGRKVWSAGFVIGGHGTEGTDGMDGFGVSVRGTIRTSRREKGWKCLVDDGVSLAL